MPNMTISKIEDDCRRQRTVMEQAYPQFYAMISPKQKKKKRLCLGCGTIFLSVGKENRVCASCGHKRIYGGKKGLSKVQRLEEKAKDIKGFKEARI